MYNEKMPAEDSLLLAELFQCLFEGGQLLVPLLHSLLIAISSNRTLLLQLSNVLVHCLDLFVVACEVSICSCNLLLQLCLLAEGISQVLLEVHDCQLRARLHVFEVCGRVLLSLLCLLFHAQEVISLHFQETHDPSSFATHCMTAFTAWPIRAAPACPIHPVEDNEGLLDHRAILFVHDQICCSLLFLRLPELCCFQQLILHVCKLLFASAGCSTQGGQLSVKSRLLTLDLVSPGLLIILRLLGVLHLSVAPLCLLHILGLRLLELRQHLSNHVLHFLQDVTFSQRRVRLKQQGGQTRASEHGLCLQSFASCEVLLQEAEDSTVPIHACFEVMLGAHLQEAASIIDFCRFRCRCSRNLQQGRTQDLDGLIDGVLLLDPRSSLLFVVIFLVGE
mmetsp:Transcript_75643/g.133495  ORF Transcript_75643/g.133495 Transcript_75643/m.133495 type:complete len:392 (-) Transcript_75643:1267-2442(-)